MDWLSDQWTVLSPIRLTAPVSSTHGCSTAGSLRHNARRTPLTPGQGGGGASQADGHLPANPGGARPHTGSQRGGGGGGGGGGGELL